MTPLALHRLLGRCLTATDSELATRLSRSNFPWHGLLEIANSTYLTPALCAVLDREAPSAGVPKDVRTYLREISRRNAIRNARLRAQLAEVAAALNHRGVAPILLKGAAAVFKPQDPYAANRMVTDLDILVACEQSPAALLVLTELGYRRIPGRAASRHTFGDFARDRDVGAIDLHVELINEPALLPVDAALARAADCTADGLHVRLLSPTDRVLHLLLHDLVQDQGIHDGRLNFRHLHEFATLARSGASIDWQAISAHLTSHRLRVALDLWMLAAGTFFAIRPPIPVASALGARILLWRALLQLRAPSLVRVSEIFGNLHRSLSWYRLANRDRRLPRLRRAADYLWMHRARTASRILHVLLDHRS
jgi:Uncharacterised nucleotidyltransferase